MSTQIYIDENNVMNEDEEEIYDIKDTICCARIAIFAVIFTFIAIVFF